MRILQIGKYYPPARGGMETVLRHICEGLLDRRHSVVALAAGVERVDRHETLRGPETGHTGLLIRCGSLCRLNSQPLTFSLPVWLRREIKRFDPELIQLHLPNPMAALSAWLQIPRGGNVPRLAVWYHADITRQRLGGRLLEPLTRSVLRRADGIAVSTASLRDQSRFLDRLRGKVAVIPFGIDHRAWAPPREDSRKARGPFLFVGRLVYYKGLDLLLDAVAGLPRAKLTIVGDGPLGRKLRQRAQRDDLRGRVRFTGELDDQELRREMAGSSALVLPSLQRSETFGLVQLEAMAAGLPVVSTQLPTGVAEVNVDGVTGRLVPPGNVTALRAVLAEILDHPETADRWAAAGRERVVESFSRSQMIADLEKWYLGLIEHPLRT